MMLNIAFLIYYTLKGRIMASRIIFLILGFVIITNLIVVSLGLILEINLYQKFGNQLFNLFAIFVFFIISVYITLSILGLS